VVESDACSCLRGASSLQYFAGPDVYFISRQYLNPALGLSEADCTEAATALGRRGHGIKAVAEVETSRKASMSSESYAYYSSALFSPPLTEVGGLRIEKGVRHQIHQRSSG
jgi:hypothetical protein